MPRKEREDIDAQIDLDEHHGGTVDPTGQVSSGLQPGPMRTKGGRPVADNDEAQGPSSRERDFAEKTVTQAELDGKTSRDDEA